MKKISIKFIAESALIAALYVALTWVFAPISYGPIQFRISEVLVLLVVFNPKYAVSLIIGCLIANTTSPILLYDMIFGTLATTLALIPMCFIKKMPVAAIFPVISNAIIVPIELGLAFENNWGGMYFYNFVTVGFGELVTLYALGIPLMYSIAKNEHLCELMELDTSHIKNYSFMTLENLIMPLLGLLGIILFIAYPLSSFTSGEDVINESAMAMLKELPFTCIYLIASIVYGLSVFVKNKYIKLSVIALAIVAFITAFVLTGVYNVNSISYPYYYGYIGFIVLFMLAPYFVIFRKKN